MSDDAKIHTMSELDAIFQKASEEIVSIQNKKRYCFSLDTIEIDDHDNHTPFYENNDITEFNYFDVLEEEIKNGGNPFDHFTNGKKYENITKDGGVKKFLLDPGFGHVIPKGSIVFLHYIGYIYNILEPFVVTHLRGKRPKCFNLGNSELLPGLDIGISTMTHSENARFIISPKYGYKEIGCLPHIPPNSTLLFDVHLVSYFSRESLPARFKEDIGNPEKFDKNLVLVKQFNFEGNEQFKFQNIEKAVDKYEKAKEILHLIGCDDGTEVIDMYKYLNKLYSNLSICYLKLCAFKKVCRMGREAMKYSGRFSINNVKLWFSWGKALRLLKDFTGGQKKLNKALNLDPQNITIQNEFKFLEQDRKFHGRIDALVTYGTEHLPSTFWEIFNTLLNEFVDSSDDILTVTLNNNFHDIMLAEHKSNFYNLIFQHLYDVGDNCFAMKKKE